MLLGSVSQLIAEAKEGDEDALARLHQRYWPTLVKIARNRLGAAPVRDRDAEDVAQDAFFSLYQSLKKKRSPNLDDRHQLLALLTHIVACKAANEIKHVFRQKRGSGNVRNVSPLEVLVEDTSHSPLQAAILNDCYDVYINEIPDKLRAIAELHLAGFTNQEIATRMQCVERTVERKLSLVRCCWRQFALASLSDEGSTVAPADDQKRA